ncbi:MAG: phosphatidate cytidylyltransferase [Flavobacteriales bacterium]|nr:phosphatidate cytidylyltransferase [Flavobacteriales bacterium]
MKELATRTLTGAVYVALVLGAAWLGPRTTALLFLPVALIAAWEWHLLYWKGSDDAPPIGLTIVLSLVVYVAACLEISLRMTNGTITLSVIAGTLLLLTFLLLRSGSTDPGKVFTGHLGTVIYATMPMAIAAALVQVDHRLFIGFMVLLWTNDTGAYLVGKLLGRNKLMPTVSPGKTWEGFVGGVLLTALVGWAISASTDVLSLRFWLVAATVVALAGTIGDLLESALKRAAGVKDSGRILPGHGGILDRFDGYLLAAPVMLLMVAFAMGG